MFCMISANTKRISTEDVILQGRDLTCKLSCFQFQLLTANPVSFTGA